MSRTLRAIREWTAKFPEDQARSGVTAGSVVSGRVTKCLTMCSAICRSARTHHFELKAIATAEVYDSQQRGGGSVPVVVDRRRAAESDFANDRVTTEKGDTEARAQSRTVR